jgi:hypothetical protein
VEVIYAYVSGIATDLVSSLMVAGGRRVRDEALGDEQKRALRKVFEEATAAVLVEVARHNRRDQNLPARFAAGSRMSWSVAPGGNLEAAPIGGQLFAHGNSQRDCAAF